jgi:hypothetical protein
MEKYDGTKTTQKISNEVNVGEGSRLRFSAAERLT